MGTIDLPAALAELKEQKRWVCWRYERDQTGNQTKVPYQPSNQLASTNNASTWSTFGAVARVADSFDGVGLVLTDSDICAFDLDDCRDPVTGVVEPWFEQLVDRGGTYTEITPSDKGLRMIGRGVGEKVHRKFGNVGANGASCEVYRKATRYITVTSMTYRDALLRNIDAVIDDVVKELNDREPNNNGSRARASAGPGASRGLPPMLESLLTIVGSGGYPSRSELLFAFITAAMRAGVDENAIISACLDDSHAGCGIFEHCRENGGESYVKRQIEHAANRTVEADGKQIIRVTKGNRHEAWRATQRAMMANGCQVFVRGDALVEPLWRWEELENDGRSVLTMKFVKYNLTRLSDQAARHAAVFHRYDARSRTWLQVDPPNDVIEALLSRGDWDFPSAHGIINTPTLRRDGSLLCVPGYDRSTGLWYKPPLNLTLPPMADQPTRDDAVAALKLLEDLLDEFPFVDVAAQTDEAARRDGVSRCVAVAGLMTPVLRGAFTVAPLFFIHKPEAGTGASYLVELISLLATGRPAVPLKASSDPKELTKELSAAAFEAKPILNLNNITFDLESPDLAQMVTEGTLDIRPFGKNDELRTCDCRAMTIFANGNNVRVVGELVRRTLNSRIDAKMECPEHRVFRHKPADEVAAARGKYLAAVFTIARAYKAAGEPQVEAVAVAGFEEWSRRVQKPLVWLGLADPFLSQEDARAQDPERGAFRARIDALVKHASALGKEYGAADIHRLATKLVTNDYGQQVAVGQDLFDAFSRYGKISVPGITWQLTKDLGRWVGEFHLELASRSARSRNTYRMMKGEEPFQPEQEAL